MAWATGPALTIDRGSATDRDGITDPGREASPATDPDGTTDRESGIDRDGTIDPASGIISATVLATMSVVATT
jgi:hypothetical protein